MRFCFIVLLMIVVCIGCNRAEEARRKAAQDNLRQIGEALKDHNEAVEPQETVTVDVTEIVEGSSQFALDLYGQLRSEEGNLFFSPASISTALAMTYAGADGGTKAEMAKTLHLPTPDDGLHDGMETLQGFWTTADKETGIRLNLANRLWSQQSFEFLPTFLQITRDKYSAELARLDFGLSEMARETINTWVEEQTENKINDLIPVGVISPSTKLVLTNAAYFHGIWADPFEKFSTKHRYFHVTATDKIIVAMMYRCHEFRHGAIGDLQVLELPYGDGSLSMIVLLPKEVDGLADLETKLTQQNVQQWMASVKQNGKVRVYLPRFKTTSQFEMNSTLQAMGMESAFDPNAADFSGMTGGKDLYISAVIHKAFVDVNEKGTVAAAATAVAPEEPFDLPGKPKPLPVFRADHPFIFMIQDNRNGALLFVGRIMNPLE